MLLEMATRLRKSGQNVDVFIEDPTAGTDWFPAAVPTVSARKIEEAVSSRNYDFVYFAGSIQIPRALHHIKSARPVLICQAYESFCAPTTFGEVWWEPEFAEIVNLPISIISTSKSIQSLLKERLNKDSYYVPVGIDEDFFRPNSRVTDDTPIKRILMVGSYLLPIKGMSDGFIAMNRLTKSHEIQVVLITQEHRIRNEFDRYNFSVEFHELPSFDIIPQIYASCHVYCCTSWYEGLGMPP